MKIRQVQCTRRVPKCLLFYLRRAFPIARFYSLLYTPHNILPLPLLRAHTRTACTRSYFSIGCNELPSLREEAVTEVFIKYTAIWKVPRTGRSHNKRDGDKLELGYGAALDDGSCQRYAPSLSILDHFKYEPNGEINSNVNDFYHVYVSVLPCPLSY